MDEADVLTKLLHAVDALEWGGVSAALDREVLVDYTSLAGGKPEMLTSDELIGRWQALLPGFEATQHVTGPVVLTEDGGPGVRADTHLVAYHWLAGETWVLHGHYTARLVGGRLAALTLGVFGQEGNLDLPRVATERVASGSGRTG